MRNLAGGGSGENDAAILAELAEARVRALRLPVYLRDEVCADVIGLLDAEPFTLIFQRAWCYWRVTCSPPMPLDAALAIDGLPMPVTDGHYSGRRGVLGDVVRADGHAGGPAPTRPVDVWHIDTLVGLVAFAGAVRQREAHA
jgi:hypothetical protein